MENRQKGITLIEILIVGAILGILFGFTIVNLRSVQSSASVTSLITQLSADIHNQQLMAMMGQTQDAQLSSSYGIHFDTDKYILFQGDTYDPSNQQNLAIDLDSNLSLQQITFPQGTLIFQAHSGVVKNFAQNTSSFDLVEKNSGKRETIQINALGVLTSAD